MAYEMREEIRKEMRNEVRTRRFALKIGTYYRAK
jgi:hypothetical protein